MNGRDKTYKNARGQPAMDQDSWRSPMSSWIEAAFRNLSGQRCGFCSIYPGNTTATTMPFGCLFQVPAHAWMVFEDTASRARKELRPHGDCRNQKGDAPQSGDMVAPNVAIVRLVAEMDLPRNQFQRGAYVAQ